MQGRLAPVRLAIQLVLGKITERPETAQYLVNLMFGIAQCKNPAHAGELDWAAKNEEAQQPAATAELQLLGVGRQDAGPQGDSTAEGGKQFSRTAVPPPVTAAPVDPPVRWCRKKPAPARCSASCGIS